MYVEVGCVEFEIRSPFQIARQCVYGVRIVVWTDMVEKEITFGIISQTHMRERGNKASRERTTDNEKDAYRNFPTT